MGSMVRGLGVEYKLSEQILKTGSQQYGSPSLGFKCIDETRIKRNSATKNIDLLLVPMIPEFIRCQRVVTTSQAMDLI